jgi:hypothetical protein
MVGLVPAGVLVGIPVLAALAVGVSHGTSRGWGFTGQWIAEVLGEMLLNISVAIFGNYFP